MSKPSDLIPELQGRFPIRVELEPLGQAEFVRILTEPRSALIKQYMALLATEGVDLRFSEDGIATIAEFATIVNERTENIGARRLQRDGAAARRSVVRSADPAGQIDTMSRVRTSQLGDSEERRSSATYCELRILLLAVVCASVACGKKRAAFGRWLRVPRS